MKNWIKDEWECYLNLKYITKFYVDGRWIKYHAIYEQDNLLRRFSSKEEAQKYLDNLVSEKKNEKMIKLDDFNKVLEHLDEKYQLVAKLLYFGGTRTLEEILSLEIQHIDFKGEKIFFNGLGIKYPIHVFTHIQNVVKNRTIGRLFLGRQNLPLYPSTIFRNFKIAGKKAGLGDCFTPKDLIELI